MIDSVSELMTHRAFVLMLAFKPFRQITVEIVSPNMRNGVKRGHKSKIVNAIRYNEKVHASSSRSLQSLGLSYFWS